MNPLHATQTTPLPGEVFHFADHNKQSLGAV
jgi:hypothetical protein